MLSLGSSNPSTSINIIPGGNVGIGTTTPGGKLSFGQFYINSSTPNSSEQISHIRLYERGSVYYGLGVSGGALNKAANQSGGTLRFYTNSIERVRIDGEGNIVIGTTNPIAKLDVNGDINISSGSLFKIGGVPISGGSSLWQTNSNSLYYNSGNVGIGTAKPQTKLEVAGSQKWHLGSDNNLIVQIKSETNELKLFLWNDGRHKFYYDNINVLAY